MSGRDRETLLQAQARPARVTGIDFVRVLDPADQRELDVYFLVEPGELTTPLTTTPIPRERISIVSTSGGERLARVPVVGAALAVGDGGRQVLRLTVAEPGDFSRYRLTLEDARIDRYFNGVVLSFKQACPSDFDCRPRAEECLDDALDDYPIDYLARDFWSLRAAMLDFAAQRYPRWRERIEADASMMVIELVAALGDELSYVQDRYAREAIFASATQRRSLRRHVRLVDYDVHDGAAAQTLLDLTVRAGAPTEPGTDGLHVRAGDRVWSPPVGGLGPVPFEIGTGLAGRGGPGFWVSHFWNALEVHVPDEENPVVPAGSTELYVRGWFPSATQVPVGEDHLRFWIGKQALLRRDAEEPGEEPFRQLVRLVEIEPTVDPLVLVGGNPIEITRLRWEPAQALACETRIDGMVVRLNLVPAIAGETFEEKFVVGEQPLVPEAERPNLAHALEREGPLDARTGLRALALLYSPRRAAAEGLAFLPQRVDPARVGDEEALRQAVPDLELDELDPATLVPVRRWAYERTLLDANPRDRAFTLEDGTWRRIIAFRRGGEELVHEDYATGAGYTIRFGDGELGRVPPEGTVFRVRYRTGPGSRANLPADAIALLHDPRDPAVSDTVAALVDAVGNPLPVVTGVDPEEPELVRMLAPEAFRAVTYRAVRREDYAEQAERLPWVQRAGASVRWTGSWLSTSVTADPEGSFELSASRRDELEELMHCVRQAGREVVVRDPEFLSLDLEIQICVVPGAWHGQVKEAVTIALTGPAPRPDVQPFFHPDHFTFGTPLRRAGLEAAVQSVPGVLGVESMRLRTRGTLDWKPFDRLVLPAAANQVLRLQNDPRFPERGSLRVKVKGEGE